MKWFRRVLYGLFLMGCLAAGAGVRLGLNVVKSISDEGMSFTEAIHVVTNPRDSFPGVNKMTLLLVGQDYNHNNKGFIYTKASRADTIMMLSMDLDSKQVRACSVPRDTFVTARDGKSGKINATFARGGIELLKDTLHDLFGVTIDHYVIVKPDAVREIVDAVGGVQVETIDDTNYDDNWGGLHVHLPEGSQHIDGAQAEGFVRFREVNRYRMDSRGNMIPLRGVKSSKEEGDIRRAARQQQLVAALMSSAKSTSNLLRADEIIDTGFNQIETDLKRSQCVALANIFKEAKESMVSGTVPGEDGKRDGVYYYTLDQERAQATVDWLIKGDDHAMRRLVRIEIRNGSKIPGVARAAANMLDAEGYNASAPGNASSTDVTTIVYRKASFEEAARAIQQLLGATSIEKDVKAGEYGPEIKIVIGSDLAEKLKAASST